MTVTNVEKKVAKNVDLSEYGINNVTDVIRNPSFEVLFEEETKPGLEGYEKGIVTELGAVSVDTGIHYTDNRDSSNYDTVSTMDYSVGLNFDGLLNWEMSQLSYFAVPYIRYRDKPALSENYTKLMGTVGFELKHRFSEVFSVF